MKSPIYTEKTECQDCYKCVRQCPVKAIRVNGGSAVVIHDKCIFCGRCIEVCPVHAKKLRSDTARAKQLIELNDSVYVSLAPSFPAEFDTDAPTLINALKALGFKGVSETSIGASIISDKISQNLKKGDKKIISSACPTINELIKKYYPEIVPSLSDVVSPLHAHAEFLKRYYGEGVKVVFIGPCISKKLEADDESTPIDLALTFKELLEWFEDEKLDLENIISSGEFVPSEYSGAAEFAIEGGMLNTLKNGVGAVDEGFISCSGIKNITETLSDIPRIAGDKKIFLEFLACDGGCISGKGMTSSSGYIKRRLDIINYYKNLKKKKNNFDSQIMTNKEISAEPVSNVSFSRASINEVLNSLEKYDVKDEINCSGCGYNSCRDFAAAVLEGKAEKSMCVTHMRNLAVKKSNALMKALPLGVVITDTGNRILECNEKFLNTFSDIDLEMSDRISDRIEGVSLNKFIPDLYLFEKIKNTGNEMFEGPVHFGKKIFRAFIFRIGKEKMAGAIFQDITFPSVRKDTVIKKTEEVIEKSLKSVQQIASLLGENAAETQLILNSLIDAFNETSEEV